MLEYMSDPRMGEKLGDSVYHRPEPKIEMFFK